VQINDTRPLTIDEIRADARRFVAGTPPPQLSDDVIVKLRTLFKPAPSRVRAA
jgi:hypothetical protein